MIVNTAAQSAQRPTLDWIRTEFNLPDSIAHQCTAFFLRVWDGDYVASYVQDGQFLYNRQEYIVHWQSTPVVVKSASRVACSFRQYNGKRYVVIKVWKGEQE